MKKRILSLTLVLILSLSLMPSALASVGDVTLFHADSSDGYYIGVNGGAYMAGNKVYYETDDGKMAVYDIESRQTEYFDIAQLRNVENYEEAKAMIVTGTSEEGNEYTEYPSVDTSIFFVYQDELYVVMTFSSYSTDGNSVDGGHIYKMIFEDGAVKTEKSELVDLDWTNMLETYDTYSYSRYAERALVTGDYLVIQTYDDDGNEILISFDLKSGRSVEHYVQNVYTAAAADEGQLIVMTYAYSETDPEVEFFLYDIESESSTPVGTMAIDNYSLPANLYYKADTDTLYYVMKGEIWAAAGFDFENAISVNDSPVSGTGAATQMSKDGYLLLADWENIVLRNTNPDERAEVTLRVVDSTYQNAVDTAYFKYTNEHGDVSVIVDRNADINDVLQAMMNRSGAVDIYTIDVSRSEYSALFERGYMAELDKSERLSEAVMKTYEGIRSVVSKDGHTYALPLSVYGSTMGCSLRAMEKLGLTEADIPTTWDGFFDFLEALPEKLTEGCGVRAFEGYYDQDSLRINLFTLLFNDYQSYINSSDNYSFNTPELKSLLERLENLDLGALDVLETTYDEENDIWYDNYDEREYLFETYVPVTVQSGSYYGTVHPMMLSITEGEPALNVNLQVAFINPFSEHVDEAIAYLETMADSLDTSDRYSFYDDLNEPIRYPDYEEYKDNIAEWLKTTEESKATWVEKLDKLKAADDPDEEEIATCEEAISNYDEQLADLQTTLEDMEKIYWLISAETIERYRARAQYIKPMTYDCTTVTSDDDTDTIWSLIMQYRDGAMGVDELLQSIDKKVQMMRLEGN